MSKALLKLHNDFWNIRDDFRVLGVLNVGTHASLARLGNGNYALLDACSLEGSIAHSVMEQTDHGRLVQAIFNLHPFHTVHTEAAARQFPDARLYGTQRHHSRLDLRWEPETTESPEFAEKFADDFEFMVPPGVHFIPENQNLHFASVLAFHKASKVLHVDDTLSWLPTPTGRKLRFHPTLKRVLKAPPDSATQFRQWAEALVTRCEDVDYLCAAHTKYVPVERTPPGQIAALVRTALSNVERTLQKHEARH